jgi:hypothetical protein
VSSQASASASYGRIVAMTAVCDETRGESKRVTRAFTRRGAFGERHAKANPALPWRSAQNKRSSSNSFDG